MYNAIAEVCLQCIPSDSILWKRTYCSVVIYT